MPLSITQIFLTLFLLFAASRVFLRFKGGDLSLFGFLFWSGLFGSAIIFVLFPNISSEVAKLLNIGRGVDAILYVSITLLFYLVFRLYIYLEDIRHDITELIQKLAMKEIKKNGKKPTKD
jgi:hypothetical protein